MTSLKPLSRDPSARSMHRCARRTLCVALTAAFAVTAQAATDLTALSLEQLLEVTVVGASKYEQKQSEVAAAVSVITRDEIKVYGWRTLDQALASLPGVHITYDRRDTNLGMRGFGLPGDYNTRVLFTVNGNRVNEPTYDNGPLGRAFLLDMDLVERIEFIPGPGGAVYGQNAMFGVVNVVTRGGSDVDGAELAVAYQHPQALREGRVSWGRRLDNETSVLVSVAGARASGEDRFFNFGVSGVSGVAAGLDGEHDKEFFARISRGPWSFDFMRGDHVKNDPTGAFFSDPLVPGQYQATRFALAQLQYQQTHADGTLNVSGRLFAGQERFSGSYSFGTVFIGQPRSDWHGGELRLLSSAVEGHKLMLGIELQNNVRQDQNVLNVANPAYGLSIPGSGYRAGVYAQDEWRIAPTLTATLGLRVDRNDVTGTESSPRAALIWQAATSTTVKALYGRAHRAPNVFERDFDNALAQVANPALNGERIDTLELVADHRVGADLTLRGSLYQWTMNDIITLGVEPARGLLQYQSGPKVKARGLELSADKTWSSGARLRGSVSMQDVAYAGGARLFNSPKLLGKLNLSAPLPWAGLRAGYELRYDGKRLTQDGSQLGGYAVSNLNLSTEALAKGLELSLGIQNLFDMRYAQPGSSANWQNALEQDGRSTRLSATYRF